MAVENWNQKFTFKAAEDLSAAGSQYQAITIADNKVANNGQEANGILVSKPKSGEHGTYVGLGVTKARAGGAVAANATITVATSGYITVTASNDFICGYAMEAITSGSLGTVFWNPSRHYQVSSIDG